MELLLSGIQRLLCLTYVISLTIVCITAAESQSTHYTDVIANFTTPEGTTVREFENATSLTANDGDSSSVNAANQTLNVTPPSDLGGMMVGNETNKDRSEETMAEGLQPTTTTWPNASNETNVTTDLPDAKSDDIIALNSTTEIPHHLETMPIQNVTWNIALQFDQASNESHWEMIEEAINETRTNIESAIKTVLDNITSHESFGNFSSPFDISISPFQNVSWNVNFSEPIVQQINWTISNNVTNSTGDLIDRNGLEEAIKAALSNVTYEYPGTRSPIQNVTWTVNWSNISSASYYRTTPMSDLNETRDYQTNSTTPQPVSTSTASYTRTTGHRVTTEGSWSMLDTANDWLSAFTRFLPFSGSTHSSHSPGSWHIPTTTYYGQSHTSASLYGHSNEFRDMRTSNADATTAITTTAIPSTTASSENASSYESRQHLTTTPDYFASEVNSAWPISVTWSRRRTAGSPSTSTAPTTTGATEASTTTATITSSNEHEWRSISNHSSSTTTAEINSSTATAAPTTTQHLSTKKPRSPSAPDQNRPWNGNVSHEQNGNHFNSFVHVEVDSGAEVILKIDRLQTTISKKLEDMERVANMLATQLLARINKLETALRNNNNKQVRTVVDEQHLKNVIRPQLDANVELLLKELKAFKCSEDVTMVTDVPLTTDMQPEFWIARETPHVKPSEVRENSEEPETVEATTHVTSAMDEWREQRERLMQRWENNFRKGLHSKRRLFVKRSNHPEA